MADYDFDDAPYVVIEQHEHEPGVRAFLAGLAIGAGLALFLAPQTGAAMRRAVRERATRMKESARNVADDVSGTVTDRFHQARQDVEDRIESARTAVELKKQQVQRAVQAGRAAAHDARENLERRLAETKAAYDEPVEPPPTIGTPTVTTRIVKPGAGDL